MRRFSSNVASYWGTRAASFGAAVSAEEISQATRVAGSNTPVRVGEASWASVDIVRRQRHQVLADSVTALPLFDIRNAVAAQEKAPAAVDVKALFTKGEFKNIDSMVQAYEEGMYSARKLKKQADDWQIDIYGLKDHIRLGLNLFSQDVLDEKKKSLVETEKKLAAAKVELKKMMEKNFSTGIYNDIINVLRIAGSRQEHARDMAMRVLDDMSTFGIPMDNDSQMLLKNVTFGDGPQEDSNLLFTMCEFPERGDVSVSGAPLEQIADETLKVIAARHQTPLTPSSDEMGKLYRMNETVPLLQRSSD